MTQVLDRERLEDIGTLDEDDLCHVGKLRTDKGVLAFCGVLIRDEPICCGIDPPCGRPPCPECTALSGARR